MGDHGASAIIPANIVLMCACTALAAFTLPWWMATGVVVLMLALRNYVRDQYGGMQLCLLLLVGLLAGILTLGQALETAKRSGESVEWLRMFVLAAAPALLFPVLLLITMAIPVAAALAWEWIRNRISNNDVRQE